MDNPKHVKLNYGFLMTAVVCGAFLMGLASSTINIALPYLMKHFDTSLDTVKWAMTGFMLATGIVAPLTCYFGEKYSYKSMYIIAAVGFTLSSGLCALAWNVHVLIAFRIMQGAFNGLAVPSTMSIIYQVVPKKKLAFSISLWSLAAMLAPAFGPTLSGWLIQNFDWQAIFIINLPIGILATVLIIRGVPFYKLSPPQGFDLPGFAACLSASVLLLLTFSEAAQWGWTSALTLGCLAAGLGLLGLFIVRELRARTPMLNLAVFRSRGYMYSVIVRSIVTMALYAGTLLTPLFLQNAQKVSALDAGLLMLPPSLAMALMMLVVGKLYHKLDPRLMVVAGIVLMAAGSWLMSSLTVETSHVYIVMCMSFRNVGIALATTPVTNMGMSSLERKMAGSGSSINNWVSQSIGCLSIGMFTSLLTYMATAHGTEMVSAGEGARLGKELLGKTAFVMGVNDVYRIAAVIVLLALPFCFLLKPEKQQSEVVPDTSEAAA